MSEDTKLKFYENKDFLKMVSILIGLGGISIYFYRKNNELTNMIEQLVIRLEEQEIKIDKLYEINGLSRYQHRSYQRPPTPQPASRPPQQQAPAQQPQLFGLLSTLMGSMGGMGDKELTVTEVEDEEVKVDDNTIAEELKELKEDDTTDDKSSKPIEIVD